MSIYIFGDTHGPLEINKLSEESFPESKTMGCNDYVIICGDFGFPFLTTDANDEPLYNKHYRESRKQYLFWRNWMAMQPYNILFVDGNHENHPFWEKQPVETWHGGKIQRLPGANNVIHLMRGEYYEIDGHTFWTFGGAASHDKEYRTQNIDWWPEEVATYKEMQYGLDNLEKHENKVDYIITHTMPQFLVPIYKLDPFYVDAMQHFFDEVYCRTKGNFICWYCGHMHKDKYTNLYKVQIAYNKYYKIE